MNDLKSPRARRVRTLFRFAFAASLAATCAVSLGTAQAAASAATVTDTIAELGRLNGVALACGHAAAISRAKETMVSRVAKTRGFGEIFENATNAAFAEMTANRQGCPPAAVVNVEMELVAQRLAAPASHSVNNEVEAPAAGLNPRYLLQDVNGRAFMDGDFPRQFQLVTFGYTFCPDICPTTLQEMAEVLKKLGDDAAQVRPMFVSVDPERDTLRALRAYTAFFDARIIGATAAPELVKRAADSFKVRYQKVVDPNTDPAHYAVDHTAGMYLLAPGGGFLARFVYRTPVDDIVARIREEIKARPGMKPEAPK